MSRELVTVEKITCDGCGSTIGDANRSASGSERDVQVMGVQLRLRVVVNTKPAKPPGADLCESCLREALKDAGLA